MFPYHPSLSLASTLQFLTPAILMELFTKSTSFTLGLPTLSFSFWSYRSFATTVSQHNSVTIQQCHNTAVSQHNSVTTVSQLKICDFSGETFKGFEVL